MAKNPKRAPRPQYERYSRKGRRAIENNEVRATVSEECKAKIIALSNRFKTTVANLSGEILEGVLADGSADAIYIARISRKQDEPVAV